MFKNMGKTIIPISCACVMVLASFSPVMAEAEEDPNDAYIVTKSLDENTTEKLNKKQLMLQNTADTVNKGFDALQQAVVTITTWRESLSREVMPYYDEFKSLISERVLSRFGAENVNMKLDEIMMQMISAHRSVENVGTEGETNPFAGTTAAGMQKSMRF